MARSVLYDSTLCVGCRACEQACAARWDLPYNDSIGTEERLSAHKLTTIVTHPDKIKGDRYSRRMCMHCAEPTCVSVCPVGALQKTALGPVVYDPAKCMGCRYCIQACPYGCRFLNPKKNTADKCTLCYHRITRGLTTACCEACPTHARVLADLKNPKDPVHEFLRTHKVQILKPQMATGAKVFYANLDGSVR